MQKLKPNFEDRSEEVVEYRPPITIFVEYEQETFLLEISPHTVIAAIQILMEDQLPKVNWDNIIYFLNGFYVPKGTLIEEIGMKNGDRVTLVNCPKKKTNLCAGQIGTLFQNYLKSDMVQRYLARNKIDIIEVLQQLGNKHNSSFKNKALCAETMPSAYNDSILYSKDKVFNIAKDIVEFITKNSSIEYISTPDLSSSKQKREFKRTTINRSEMEEEKESSSIKTNSTPRINYFSLSPSDKDYGYGGQESRYFLGGSWNPYSRPFGSPLNQSKYNIY